MAASETTPTAQEMPMKRPERSIPGVTKLVRSQTSSLLLPEVLSHPSGFLRESVLHLYAQPGNIPARVALPYCCPIPVCFNML